jgi:hypothetical protein
MNMERIEEMGRRMLLAAAMNHTQREATVGASSERRCQRSRRERWVFRWGFAAGVSVGCVEVGDARATSYFRHFRREKRSKLWR